MARIKYQNFNMGLILRLGFGDIKQNLEKLLKNKTWTNEFPNDEWKF